MCQNQFDYEDTWVWNAGITFPAHELTFMQAV
jgi:hypothetical protein